MRESGCERGDVGAVWCLQGSAPVERQRIGLWGYLLIAKGVDRGLAADPAALYPRRSCVDVSRETDESYAPVPPRPG